MTKPLLGVIGGMGTQATAWFYEKLHTLQTVTVEQDYLDVLLYSMPSIPDRTAFITGQSTESPLFYLIHAAKTLESSGVSCIALPCATSHYFYDELSEAVNVPILNILEETARYAEKQGHTGVCLFATDGTLKGRAFHSAFDKYNIAVSLPSPEVQKDLMTLIYDIKRGAEVRPGALEMIIKNVQKAGAQTIILGCTELCVIANESPDTVNILTVLAKSALNKLT